MSTIFKCTICGGTIEFVPGAAFGICDSCGTKQTLPDSVTSESVNSEIAIDSDVQRLLDKCRRDPRNARKYANLILDIDPTNREVQKYL